MSYHKILMLIFLVLSEFIHGFTLSFCMFMTLKHIFFRKTGKFVLFSFCSGTVLSAVLTIKFLTSNNSVINITLVMEWGLLLILILSGWLLLTKRDIDSLISTVFAAIFSVCTVISMRKLVFSFITFIISDSDKVIWFEFPAYIIIYLLSISFIFLFSLIAKNKEREPLSKCSMLLLTGTILAIIIFVEDEFTFSENVSDVNPVAAIPLFVTFLFIVTAVMLSVKSSQARYYSRLNSLNEEYLTAQVKHFEKVRESDTEMKKLRHDIKNHILCMNELYKLKKYDELGEYLNQLSNTVSEIQSAVKTGNEIVDAIINEKSADTKESKIKINVDGNFKEIYIPALDLCTILSNLLDNAVEAVSNVDESEREILLSTRKTGNFIFLTVKNSTFDFVEISDKIKTTKSNKKKHGFGIENVRKAVLKCGGEFHLNCSKEKENYIFTAEVMLPIKSQLMLNE